MSRWSGHTLNPQYFMEDPVSKEVSTVTNTDATSLFIVKGDQSTSGISTSDSHNDNEKIIVTVEGESYTFDRKVLRNTLQELKPHAHDKVKSLSANKQEMFEDVVNAMRILYSSPKYYKIIMDDILIIFADVKNVVPETVGSYFIGCTNDKSFTGPSGCSPKCVASLPAADGYSECDDLVLVYADGDFGSLNEKRSEHAFIYIDPKFVFRGFSKDNIHKLKNNDIEKVSLIFANSDGSYREITQALPVNQLPKDSSTSSNSNSSSSSSNAGGIVVFIILLILIAIALFYLFTRNKYY